VRQWEKAKDDSGIFWKVSGKGAAADWFARSLPVFKEKKGGFKPERRESEGRKGARVELNLSEQQAQQ
jgi:hypothetical protein